MIGNHRGIASAILGKDLAPLAALALLSSALLRAWFTLAINLKMDVEFLGHPWATTQEIVAFFLLPIAFGRFALEELVYLASDRIGSLKSMRWLPQVSCLLLVGGLALASIAAHVPALGIPALVGGALALSIGYESYLLLWYELFSTLDFDLTKRLIVYRVGFDAAAALLWFLPAIAAGIFCLFAPVAAWAGYSYLKGSGALGGRPSQRRWLTFEPKRSMKLAVGVFSLCMGFAFLQSAFQNGGPSPFGSLPPETAAFFSGRFVTFVLLIASLHALRDLRFELLIRLSVMAGAVGFLCLLLPFDYSFFIFCTAIVVSAFIVEYAVTLMTIYVASYTTAPSSKVIAWGQLIMRAAGIPTILLGITLAPHISADPGNPTLPWLVSVAVGLLMIVDMWLIDERGIGTFLWGRGALHEKPESKSETVEGKATRLATTYQLTSREAEICQMLLEGRSVPFIKESLYLSANTVKTHVRHIYQKTGVHNRQELIDKTL